MANALLTPTKWTDGNVSPPASWNGTSYECIAPGGASVAPVQSNLVAPFIAKGDSVDFLLSVVTPDTSDASPYCEVVINGVQVFKAPVSAVGNFTFHSGQLNAGDTVSIDFYYMSGAYPYGLYSGDYRITPIATAAFWTDFVGTLES